MVKTGIHNLDEYHIPDFQYTIYWVKSGDIYQHASQETDS